MPDSNLTTLIVTGVLGIGGGGTISVIASNYFNRKKTGADTAAVILKAGAEQVISQAAQLQRQSEQLEKQDTRLDELGGQFDLLVKRSREHSAWDWKVVEALRAASIPVEPPPPLGVD